MQKLTDTVEERERDATADGHTKTTESELPQLTDTRKERERDAKADGRTHEKDRERVVKSRRTHEKSASELATAAQPRRLFFLPNMGSNAIIFTELQVPFLSVDPPTET